MRHFTTPATSGNWELHLYAGISGSTTGVTVLFNKVKLEEGTMATSWSASPDDTRASMTELEDSIDDLDAEMEDRIIALIGSLGLSEQFASASDFLDAVAQIELIRSECGESQKITIDMPFISGVNMVNYATMPMQVAVGGATIFVVNVERYEKF